LVVNWAADLLRHLKSRREIHMKLVTRGMLIILCILTPAWAGDLRMGRAAVNITPPLGMPMGGYYKVRLNTGTHDPLYTKAIVLEEGGMEAAIVACDLRAFRAASSMRLVVLFKRQRMCPRTT
jgi:hypothetical protein